VLEVSSRGCMYVWSVPQCRMRCHSVPRQTSTYGPYGGVLPANQARLDPGSHIWPDIPPTLASHFRFAINGTLMCQLCQKYLKVPKKKFLKHIFSIPYCSNNFHCACINFNQLLTLVKTNHWSFSKPVMAKLWLAATVPLLCQKRQIK